MKHVIASVCFSLSLAMPVQAATDDQHTALYEALMLDDIVDVLREEGIGYGGELGTDMFPERADDQWLTMLNRIYDADTMRLVLGRELKSELSDTNLDPLIAFFTSDTGRQIISLEISGRQALLDEAVEEASIEAFERAAEDNTARYQLIKEFAEANDLIETNVVGSLNSNYAFFLGLIDGGGMPNSLTDEQILMDVWSREPEIRENTTEWLYSYLLMAYQPLPDSSIQDYIALSNSDEGKALNRALFAAFDVLFTDISKALGLGASQFMIGEDI